MPGDDHRLPAARGGGGGLQEHGTKGGLPSMAPGLCLFTGAGTWVFFYTLRGRRPDGVRPPPPIPCAKDPGGSAQSFPVLTQ